MISQPSKYLDQNHTPAKIINNVLIKFLESQYPSLVFEGVRDMKGNLVIRAGNTGESAYDSETDTYTAISMRWDLKSHDVENVVDVIKSKQHKPENILAKFNLKFTFK